ncbi:MAG TPA: VOC family protein [Solirubrobacteraceae bacterium]|jgi:catechol 2,3-dioxygenase-like lactoylglutathione lyase family enzyme|nr:VOC family protein [Solirubrobacteraceae bacterium]
MITGTDFVALHGKDLEASSAFYRDVLGLERSVFVPERGFSEYETGNLTISVIDPARMGLEHTPSKAGIALHVDDVAASRAELEAKGIQFFGETLDTGVCHMAFFADPDGNALLLHHRYAPRE